MPKYHLNTMKFDELHAIWVNKLVLHHGPHGPHGPVAWCLQRAEEDALIRMASVDQKSLRIHGYS